MTIEGSKKTQASARIRLGMVGGGEGAFIGSDSQLVAPVRIGKGAYVATGTTVTRDVPDDALAIARVKQENKEGYASKLKARLKASVKK